MIIYADKFYAITKYLKSTAKNLELEEIIEGLEYDTNSNLFTFWEPLGDNPMYLVLTLQERAEKILSLAENELDALTGVNEVSNQDIIDWLACCLADGSDTESIIGGKEVEHENGFYIYEMN